MSKIVEPTLEKTEKVATPVTGLVMLAGGLGVTALSPYMMVSVPLVAGLGSLAGAVVALVGLSMLMRVSQVKSLVSKLPV